MTERTLIFLLLSASVAGCLSVGCASVRPEQRAILADPSMQFEGAESDEQALQHALENREGAYGGGTVEGGGCGCN